MELVRGEALSVKTRDLKLEKMADTEVVRLQLTLKRETNPRMASGIVLTWQCQLTRRSGPRRCARRPSSGLGHRRIRKVVALCIERRYPAPGQKALAIAALASCWISFR